MVPLVGVVLVAVVDADRNAVGLAGRDELREVVFVGHADVIHAAHLLRIDPHRAEPVRAFEVEHDPLAGPLGRKLDVALVPGGPHVLVTARQPVDVAIGIFITDAVVVGDAREGDGLLESMVVARRERPAAKIHDVRLKTPLPAQIHLCGLCGGRMQREKQTGRHEGFDDSMFHYAVFVSCFSNVCPRTARTAASRRP